MSVSFYVEARGLVNVRRVLDKLSYFDARDLLDHVGAVVENQIRRRIEDQEGPPDGGSWDPLSDNYAARKGRISDGGFLELHGDLRDSMTHNVIGSDAVEIGPTIDRENDERGYPAVMQFGNKAGTIPARPYLGLSDENEDEVEQIVTDWLREVVGR